MKQVAFNLILLVFWLFYAIAGAPDARASIPQNPSISAFCNAPSGFRWYDPKTSRWLSRDPIGEEGGINLYGYCYSDPINNTDPFGLDIILENTPSVGGWHRRVAVDSSMGHYGQSFGMANRNAAMIGSFAGFSAADPSQGGAGSGVVYPDVTDPATKIAARFKTTPAEDLWALQYLQQELGNTGPYNWLTKSCRTYAKKKYKEIIREIKKQRKKAAAP